jgi:hypothetical protein
MKLQSASAKEVRRIAAGTLAGDGILIAALFLLSQFDIGTFQLSRILLGVAGGTVVAVLNFAIMCLTVQKAVDISDQKQMKAFFQGSYNGRLLLQAGWVVVALVVPQIHVLAGAAPLLFPNATIFYLQAKGKLVTPSDRPPVPREQLAEEEEESPSGPFEV